MNKQFITDITIYLTGLMLAVTALFNGYIFLCLAVNGGGVAIHEKNQVIIGVELIFVLCLVALGIRTIRLVWKKEN